MKTLYASLRHEVAPKAAAARLDNFERDLESSAACGSTIRGLVSLKMVTWLKCAP